MSHNSIAVPPFPSAGGLARPDQHRRALAAGPRTALPVREPIPDFVPPAARARLGLRARRLLRADY